MISVKNYHFQSWNEKIVFKTTVYDSWCEIFKTLMKDEKMKQLKKFLAEEVKSGWRIFPYPDLIFYAFHKTCLDDLVVVILGQDPYHGSENNVPQAMGLSFSVPNGINIPSSLKNIYNNMVKYGHISKMPTSGNLEYLAEQGVLFLNAALTVREGKPNSHSEQWYWFTDSIIEYIAKQKDFVIFVLWGTFALKKKNIIGKKHPIIISSHPSGLSCNKQMNNYSAFNNLDQFGQINKILIENKKKPLCFK